MPKEVLVIDNFYLGQDSNTQSKEIMDKESKEQRNLDTVQNLASDQKGKIKILGGFHEQVYESILADEINVYIDLEGFITTIDGDTQKDPFTKYTSAIYIFGQDYNFDGIPTNSVVTVFPSGLETLYFVDSTSDTIIQESLFSDDDFYNYDNYLNTLVEDESGDPLCPIDPVYYVAGGGLIASSKRFDCLDPSGNRGPHLPSKFQYIKRTFYDGYPNTVSVDTTSWSKAVPGIPGIESNDYFPLEVYESDEWGISHMNIGGRVMLNYTKDDTSGGSFSESIASLWTVGISWVKDFYTDTDIYVSSQYMDLTETVNAPAIRVSYEHSQNNQWPDETVTGFKIWIQQQGAGDWYLLTYVSFDKSKYFFPSNEGGTWSFGNSEFNTSYIKTLFNPEQNVTAGVASPPFMKYIPLETYYVMSGRFAGDKIDALYKTATVINKRTYIANVLLDGKIYGDRLMKSPHRQYTVFPENNYIDVAINDGDEIIKLESFADRILQFKKNTLYVINIAQEIEFLEAEFSGYGISSQSASCKTPHGIVWANREGLFIYDSEKVTNLLKTGSITKVSSEDWKKFTTFEYEGKTYERKLKTCYIVENNDIHIYNSDITDIIDGYKVNIYTGAIGSLKRRFNGSRTSNIVNFHSNTYLVDYNQEDLKILKWNKAPLMSSEESITNPSEIFSLTTKDFHFGSPATLKKIYRIYITYKATSPNANIGVYIYISVNGEENFVTGTSNFETTDGTYIDGNGKLQNTSGDWKQGWIKPKTSVTGKIYSLQIRIEGPNSLSELNLYETSDFEIDDLSIVFRSKKPK